MAELEEPGKGTTSYVFSSKGKQNEGKSKIKPAPIELSQTDSSREKYKEREKDHEKEVTITRKGTKIGHRRINEDGQITYKKQPSSALVSAIQLGIQYSVGRLSSKPERDVLMGDFYEIESVFFPSNGHQETPAHHYSDFRFKAYAPVAFRYFRELFHIAPGDFLISLCHDALVELTNPGASGSLFYVSMDDQFIIKTVQHKEAEFLQKLLPGYYLNLNQNKRTLLPKFFGLYCYQCGGKNIRLVVMNNLLPSGYKFHLKYDLKGSTFKRKASKAERAKSSPTLKDLDFMNDFPGGISVDADTHNALIKTIQRDCRVLESFKIMDYSLLLAIHNVDEAAREKRETEGEPSTARTKLTGAVATTKNTNEARQPSEKSTNELAKDAQTSAVVTRNPSGRNRDDFAAYWEAIPQDRHDETPYGAVRARNAKGDRLFLFIGIIDILQSYRLKKRLEHGLKSVVQDGDSISVHRPSFYSRRFQEFMSEKVFRKIPDSKSQITRSPSKKRASFNTGKGRERIRTSSDTDKHGNKSGEHGTKPKHSPSLDAGLANVPGDVSFMGRETKSLENVVTAQKQTNTTAEDKTKNSNVVPPKSVDSTENPDNDSSAPQLYSVSDGERPAEATRTLESSNGAEPNLEHSTEKPDDSPKNVGISSVSNGETPTEWKKDLESSNSGKSIPEHSPEEPDDSPNNVGTSSESEDKKLPEVSENERIDSFSDSEPLTEDSRI